MRKLLCSSDCSHSSNELPPSSNIYSQLIKERILFLSEDIEPTFASWIAANLIWLDLTSNDSITIYINSCGGDVNGGLLTIYDTIQTLKSPIKTICIGEAYSSAAIILSAGTKGFRFAYPNAKIMIHAVSSPEISGTQKEIEAESKRIKQLNDALMKLIAKHTGQKVSRVKRDCLKDKYFGADEAVKYGLVDHIIDSQQKEPTTK